MPIRELHRKLRALVLAACQQQTTEELAAVADDGEGDTIFAIDKIGEDLLYLSTGQHRTR